MMRRAIPYYKPNGKLCFFSKADLDTWLTNIREMCIRDRCMHIVTKKTKTEAVLPLSDEALALCGERGEGQVLSLIHI